MSGSFLPGQISPPSLLTRIQIGILVWAAVITAFLFLLVLSLLLGKYTLYLLEVIK